MKYYENRMFPTHEMNVAKNMVWYVLDNKDTPSYSYWMIPGTWSE